MGNGGVFDNGYETRFWETTRCRSCFGRTAALIAIIGSYFWTSARTRWLLSQHLALPSQRFRALSEDLSVTLHVEAELVEAEDVTFAAVKTTIAGETDVAIVPVDIKEGAD